MRERERRTRHVCMALSLYRTPQIFVEEKERERETERERERERDKEEGGRERVREGGRNTHIATVGMHEILYFMII